jgi:hypothetical protein
MTDWQQEWEHLDRYTLKYSACRTKNLAEELIEGWADETHLDGQNLLFVCDAIAFYVDEIREGRAEAHLDEICRDLVALHLVNITIEGCEVRSGENRHAFLSLGWAETQIASRALRAFSRHLKERVDAMPPEPVAA